jgi:RNA ligase (TIGR02306 family)
MKLAEIQTINEIIPIEGADRIVLAKVQGWQSVIQRGQFNVGDRIVFVPIDTVLRPETWNSFLHDKNDPTKSIRIKSVKLKGVYSQGLIFPLTILPDPFFEHEIGTDVADLIGVTKFIKPIPVHLQGKVKGDFPTHLISKTDEDNLLSNPDVLNELQVCDTLVVTLKHDGTSGSFIKELDGTFRVCSRNLELEDGDNIYWQMAKKYDLQNLMNIGTSIQGEICGSIQGNPMKLSETDLFIFNYKDLNTGSYTDRYDPLFVKLNVKDVPVIKTFSGDEIKCLTIESLLKLANLQKYNNDPAEGIVIRGFKNGKTVFSQKLQKMLSVKIINQNYKD